MKYDRYFTTPLYYVNSEPHIGHTFTTVVADILKRFYILNGKTAYFLTGTDEHGEKIQKTAQDKGLSPKEFVDDVAGKFKNIWDQLNIDYDYFIRTTDAEHKKLVQSVLQKLYDSGDIYFSSYEGKYCVGCERFLSDSELDAEGNCPVHQKKPETVKEENYFFKMSKYAPKLKALIEENTELIRPAKYRKEVLNYLEHVEDLCISRPKSRVSWGIELPFDTNYVSYVWFDALLNYLTATQYPEANYMDMWANVEHIIAKDILKTHTVYWGTMLLAMGVPMYKHLNVHGYWNIAGTKMSKSLGNVISPLLFKEKYDYEGLRYFFIKDMNWGDDSDFTLERFITVYNTDLANNYGNLISRTLGMLAKYFKGEEFFTVKLNRDRKSLKPLFDALGAYTVGYKKHFENYEFNKAMEEFLAVLDLANKLINDEKPWELFKNGDLEYLHELLSLILETIRILTYSLIPVMPKTASNILSTVFVGFDNTVVFDKFTEFGFLDKVNIKAERRIFFNKFDLEEE